MKVRSQDMLEKLDFVETKYKVLFEKENYSLLEIELITGKSHQIRAHLASIGHSLVGDIKYGGQKINQINYQLLHAYRITFPKDDNDNMGVSGKSIICEEPMLFNKMLT